MSQEGSMSEYPLPNAGHDLGGQVALVTGATSGLGWRFAEVLAAAGARVVTKSLKSIINKLMKSK